MMKHMTTALLVLAAAVLGLGAAPAEPQIDAPVAPKAEVKAVPKAPACKKAADKGKACEPCLKAAQPAGDALPADARIIKNDSNDMVSWYRDKAGTRYLVYVWGQPATVFSRSFAKGGKALPGDELMVLSPKGRSKGKIKSAASLKVACVGRNTAPGSILRKGDIIAVFKPIEMTHDSVDNAAPTAVTMPGWGEGFASLWKSTGLSALIEQSSADFKSTWILGLGRVVMTLVALLLIYLAIVKGFEPLLLLPIGFGALLANIPLAGISNPGGLQWMIYQVGIESGVFPLLIFMGVGAMTDFGPLIANPKTALLGGAAQFGIFTALLGALVLTWAIPASSSVSVTPLPSASSAAPTAPPRSSSPPG